jgi:ABC-type branched-subunit amino acid transport system substrate-binding protein
MRSGQHTTPSGTIHRVRAVASRPRAGRRGSTRQLSGRLWARRPLAAGSAVLLSPLAACGGSTSSSPSTSSSGGSSGTGTINIAVIGPMTGPAAEIGNLMSGACYAAVLDVNKAGGVLGRKVSCALVEAKVKQS